MRIVSTILAIATGGIATAASATQIDLATYVNANASGYTAGGNYPAPGQTAIGGIAFQLAGFGGGTGVVQQSGQGATFTFGNYNISDAAFAYVIINSAFGQNGATIGSLTFTGTGAASTSFALTEGVNVRDHYYGGYNNSASQIFATAAYQNGVAVPDGPGLSHFDVYRFSLAGLNGQNLASIAFTGNNSGGGQAFVAGITTAGAAAGAVPEPASWALLVAGFGVAGLALRARRRAPTPA